jgi:hypothetical protein
MSRGVTSQPVEEEEAISQPVEEASSQPVGEGAIFVTRRDYISVARALQRMRAEIAWVDGGET